MTADRLDEKALEARIEEKVRHHGADSETGRLLRDLRDALASRASTGTDPGRDEIAEEAYNRGYRDGWETRRPGANDCPASPARAESDPLSDAERIGRLAAAAGTERVQNHPVLHALSVYAIGGGYENFRRLLACIVELIDAPRSLSPGPDPREAAWYEADGSVTMLPAEEVTRRRKLAAKVIEAAQWVVFDAEAWEECGEDGANRVVSYEVSPAEFEAICAALQDLDASPSSDTGTNPSNERK